MTKQPDAPPREDGDRAGAIAEDVRREADELVARHRVASRIFSAVALTATALAVRAPALRGEALALAVVLAGASWLASDRARRTVFDALFGAVRNELSRGELDAADRIVDAIDRKRWEAAVAGLRAETSLARGDARGAAELLRGAVRREDDARGRSLSLWLRSTLSLANALAGDAEGALGEVAIVRRVVERRAYGPGVLVSVDGVKQALARAALAEIVVASRASSGRFDAARVESLAADARRLVLDATCARERALFRALERMARAKVSSVYRAPEAPTRADDATPAEWVARVVPDARPFTSNPRAAAPPRAPEAGPEPAGSSSRGGYRAAARLAAAGCVVVLVCSALLSAIHDPRRPSDPAQFVGLAAVVVVVGALVAVVRSRRVARTLRAANEVFSRAATCPSGVARALVIALDTAGAKPIVEATKEIALARIARTTGDFTAALAHADRAERALDRSVRPLDAFAVRGEASAERALALALIGRSDDARALVSSASRLFSGRAALAVRVEIYAALARGDVDGARAAALRVPENLTLDRRSELVVDLLRATSDEGGVGLVADERIRAELDEPSARAFVDAVAPSLARAFEGASAVADGPAES